MRIKQNIPKIRPSNIKKSKKKSRAVQINRNNQMSKSFNGFKRPQQYTTYGYLDQVLKFTPDGSTGTKKKHSHTGNITQNSANKRYLLSIKLTIARGYL